MIASIIKRTLKKNYRILVDYILDKKNDGAKIDSSEHAWATNCATPDDLDLAVAQIVNSQKLNMTSNIDKTMHLVVSLAEGESLTPEQFKYVEKRLCETPRTGSCYSTGTR